MAELTVGELIRKYRIMTGFTQADVAKKLSEMTGTKVMPSAVAGYESGIRVPKVEVRNMIAEILGVDPVALSGLELTETDEKRLLIKLLAKYANGLKLNKDCTVEVELPVDFAGFQLEYEDNKKQLAKNVKDLDEDSLEYKLTKRQTDDELDYWMEMYPGYDAAYLCKAHKEELTVENLIAKRKFVGYEQQVEFFRYQDRYLTPQLNKEIMEMMEEAKKKKKDGE